LKPSTAEAINHEQELKAIDHEPFTPSTMSKSLGPSTAEAISYEHELEVIDRELLKTSIMS
jgi:hypothetical protein